jgi:hypothetical protein
VAAGVPAVLCASLTTGFAADTAASAAGGTRPAAVGAQTPVAGTEEPSVAELQAALLSQQDLGPSYTLVPSGGASQGSASPGSGSTTVTGCPQLSSLLNATTSNSQTVASETFQVGQLGPFLSEALLTAPAATLNANYARDKAALTSCKTMTINAGGVPLKLTLTPTDLGVAGSTAVRLDGSSDGVQINGDLGIDHVGQVEMGFVYLQLDSTSQQGAMALFKQADAKVRHAFETTA